MKEEKLLVLNGQKILLIGCYNSLRHCCRDGERKLEANLEKAKNFIDILDDKKLNLGNYKSDLKNKLEQIKSGDYSSTELQEYLGKKMVELYWFRRM